MNLSNITYGNYVIVAVFSSLFFLNIHYLFNIYSNSLLLSFCYYLFYDLLTMSPIGVNVIAWLFTRQFYMFYKKRFIDNIALRYYLLCNTIFFTLSNVLLMLLFNQSNLNVMLWQIIISSVFTTTFYGIYILLKSKNDTFTLHIPKI